MVLDMFCPLIGILMATYNGEKFIEQQLQSLISQTYSNWKLLIHDDGSVDGTIDIVKKFQSMYSDKIIYIEDYVKFGNAKKNFGYLFKIAKEKFNFEYIMFCDQDDVWYNDKIEKTLERMRKVERLHPDLPVLVHTDLEIVDENLITIHHSMFQYQKLDYTYAKNIRLLAVENCITGCTVMINKKLYELLDNIPEEAIMHDWWLGLICLKNNGIIEFISNSTIKYRQHNLNNVGAVQRDFFYYVKKAKDLKRKMDAIYNQASKASISKKYCYWYILKIKLSLYKLFNL